MQEMEEFYDEEAAEGMGEDSPVDEGEIQQILVEYHRKQLIENLTGPGVSLVLHIVLLTLMFVFIVTQPRRKEPAVVVEIAEIDEVELEPEVLEEIDEIEEEEVQEEAPISEPTDAPTDTVGAEDSIVDVSDEAPMTDDNMDTDEILDVVRTDSPLKFSGPLGGRSSAGRAGLVRKYGGSRRGQDAVSKALRWLARVQNENGSWGVGKNRNGDPAHSGLALLVFLAHGETPLSKEYGKTVQNAMRWLAAYANGSEMDKSRAYSHAIATYALSESYAMTKIQFLQTAMDRAVARIIDGQQSGGGFDYHYRKTERWDVSVTSWQSQALKAARVAGSTNEGLKGAIAKNIKFLRGPAYNRDYNKFFYAPGKPNGKGNLTGAGSVALQLLGAGKAPEVKGSLEFIGTTRLDYYREVAQHPAKWREVGGDCLYGWYYDTQAVFNSQDDGKGKSRWKEWRAVFEKVLIHAQSAEGYWETNGQHKIGAADIPGRVLATCFCALQLEVYYRYLPTFNIKKMDAAAAKDLAGIDNVGGAVGGEGLVIEIK